MLFPTAAKQAGGNPDLMIQRFSAHIDALQRLGSRSRCARRELHRLSAMTSAIIFAMI
ncbi:hypothetical protein PY365_19485 [Roseiarcaceae bacterium H3SJ34-1]|uniref:hypothetical protein n=1 Tax=Terripilifer ovatus TaxID=3032367 RepID=UPI003AB95D5F|nr:hypothetical protein [Roseiarcaceae bacterium H3SJ34-1]